VNIWQSYNQKRRWLVHFIRLLAVWWPGRRTASLLECPQNFSSYCTNKQTQVKIFSPLPATCGGDKKEKFTLTARELNWPELTCNKSNQLHNTSRRVYWLAAAKLGRLVLDEFWIAMRIQFANWTSVHVMWILHKVNYRFSKFMQCVSDGEARLPAWKLLVFTCRLGYSQVAFVFLRRNGDT